MSKYFKTEGLIRHFFSFPKKKKHRTYENGAHFKYSDLYKILLNLISTLSADRIGNKGVFFQEEKSTFQSSSENLIALQQQIKETLRYSSPQSSNFVSFFKKHQTTANNLKLNKYSSNKSINIKIKNHTEGKIIKQNFSLKNKSINEESKIFPRKSSRNLNAIQKFHKTFYSKSIKSAMQLPKIRNSDKIKTESNFYSKKNINCENARGMRYFSPQPTMKTNYTKNSYYLNNNYSIGIKRLNGISIKQNKNNNNNLFIHLQIGNNQRFQLPMNTVY